MHMHYGTIRSHLKNCSTLGIVVLNLSLPQDPHLQGSFPCTPRGSQGGDSWEFGTQGSFGLLKTRLRGTPSF
jgi:hypothetical protein